MIYIYGDSHANNSFNGLKISHVNNFYPSVTMHRIGRDNIIVNFDNSQHCDDDILCFVYGEIDCRCHIQRQIDSGKNEDYIIEELVQKYFITIQNNIKKYKKIIIVGIIPQVARNDYENINGPLDLEFPFVGSDEDRVKYTYKINKLIEDNCKSKDYVYFNPYSFYTNENGTLNFGFSDQQVHLRNNEHFLEEFYLLL